MTFRTLYFSFVFLLIHAMACTSNQPEEQAKTPKPETFGAEIDTTGAISMEEFLAAMEGKGEMNATVTAKIVEVCQKKGCWMNLETGDGNNIRITFKDYEFFVPKDCAGKTAIVKGLGYRDTTEVSELRHYAEDAGQSKEEIEKITEPEISISFEAEGVVIR